MPFNMYSPGTSAIMRAMFSNRGPINPMSYDDERRNNAAIQYGNSLMRGTGNPQGTTSGAVRDAGEKVTGAILSGWLGKSFNDKEKTANDQWTNIMSGSDGLEGMQQRAQAYGEGLDPKVASQIGYMAMADAMDKPNRDMQQAKIEEERRRWEADHSLDIARLKIAQQQAGAAYAGTWSATPDGRGLINNRTGELRMLPESFGKNQGSAFDKESGKLFAKDFVKLNEGAEKASTSLANVNAAQKAVDSGIYTGVGGDAVHMARRLGGAIGLVDQQDVANAEELRKLQNEMALIVRNPDSGMGLPGAASDRDVAFLQSMAAGLDKTPEANKRFLEASRRVYQRKLDLAEAANTYVERHGKLDANFYSQVRRYAKENPMFSGLDGYDQAMPAEAPAQGSGARPALSSF